MSGRRCPLLAVLASLVTSPVAQAQQPDVPLTIYIDDTQSLSSLEVDGQSRRLMADMLRQAAENAGIAVDIRLLPWQRAYRQAMKDPASCLSGMVLTAQRALLFQWVGPLASPAISLFGIEGRRLHPMTMAEVIDKGYRVGTAQDDIADALRAQFPGLHIDFLRSQDLGPKMLASHRIDLWVAPTASGVETLRREGVDAEDVLQMGRLDVGLGCGLSIDNARIDALRASIDRLKNRQWMDIPQHLGLQARNSSASH